MTRHADRNFPVNKKLLKLRGGGNATAVEPSLGAQIEAFLAQVSSAIVKRSQSREPHFSLEQEHNGSA
jgi:hypothetical protein